MDVRSAACASVVAAGLALAAGSAHASLALVVPAPVQVAHEQRMQKVSPALRRMLGREARKLVRDPATDPAALRVDLQFLYENPDSVADTGGLSIDVLMQMVMMEATRQSEAEMRDLMTEMEHRNEQKKAARDAADAADKAQLQALHEKHARMIEWLSAAQKKSAPSAGDDGEVR